ncbi:MAG: GNAT family N-acetyltransferase [Burkholderiales bacterium]|nr:GNAT family N-acetyltransferase [Burkholderiales bacterium]
MHTVRPIQQDDFKQWLVLWNGYNRFYGRYDETALPAIVTQTTWSRFFDAEEPVFAYVAEESGELLGFVHYLFHRHTSQIAPACYLQDLFTAEGARNKGVGNTLIHTVYEQAKQASCPSVYWHTQETNATARRLYDQVAANSGFIVYRKALSVPVNPE